MVGIIPLKIPLVAFVYMSVQSGNKESGLEFHNGKSLPAGKDICNELSLTDMKYSIAT